MQLFTHIYQLKLIPPTGNYLCVLRSISTHINQIIVRLPLWHSWPHLGRDYPNPKRLASGPHTTQNSCGRLSSHQRTGIFVMWRTRWTKPTSIRRIDRIFLDFPSIEKMDWSLGHQKAYHIPCRSHNKIFYWLNINELSI